jgi:hypothetical protein
MDFQLLFNIACSIAGTVIGWLFKVLWDAIRDLKEDIKEIEKGYVQKDDYRVDIADIKGMLARLFDRLDRQVDNK